MQTLILKLQYDGTEYAGWQIQHNANSIQGTIQNAIGELTGLKVNLIGAGRTDTGVHARRMIAHTELTTDINIPIEKLTIALNSLLPKDIRILDSIFTEKKFNARFDAIARHYSYSIHQKETVFDRHFSTYVRYQIDNKLLEKAANYFIGKHDFTGFSKNNPDTKSYLCNVMESRWEIIDENRMIYHIKADRFVYGMVRSIIGTQIDVARGKKTIDDINQTLEHPTRENISPMAPAKGLVLEKILYPKELDFFD